MNRKFYFWIFLAALLLGITFFFKATPQGAAAMMSLSLGGTWLLPIISVAALLDSVNPCAFSVLLLTIGFLYSLGRARSGIIKIGSSYIFGIFVVYVLIGFGILSALHFFGIPHFMAKVGALLLIVLGLINIINDFFPKFPIKFKIPQASHPAMARLMDKASHPAAFLLGALVALCEFPCTGGPYLTALGLLHDQSTKLAGIGYLLLYNLIFVAPLAVVLAIASEESLLGKIQVWKKNHASSLSLWGGLAAIVLGLLIFML